MMGQGSQELRDLLAMRQSLTDAEAVLDKIVADFVMRNPWAKGAIPKLMEAARR